MLKVWVRKYLIFYAENFCLSKPMEIISLLIQVGQLSVTSESYIQLILVAF